MDEYERCGSASVTYASVHEELTKSNPDFDISALQPLKQEVMTSKLVKLGDNYVVAARERHYYQWLRVKCFNARCRFQQIYIVKLCKNYIRVVQMPRCKCIESNLTYLDGKSESLVYTNPRVSRVAQNHLLQSVVPRLLENLLPRG